MILVEDGMTIIDYSVFLQNMSDTSFFITCNEHVEAKISKQHFISLKQKINGYLVLYIKEGQGTAFANGEMVGLKKHDVLIVNLQKDCYVTSDSWLFEYIHLSGNVVEKLMQDKPYCFSINDPVKMSQYFDSILLASKTNNIILQTANSLLLLDELLQNHKNTYNIKSHQYSIRIAQEYLEQNYMKALQIDDVADLLHFSKFHFIRLFKSQTGKTPYQYLLEVRVNQAKYLLKKTTLQAKEISRNCGYNSEINFTTSFKKNTGLTPLEYRRKEVVE
ncbi:MAG: helix-turn-helix transcriptional regulator [Bacilli bacterium]|nr:helix-turn-helix transcriptional regulator [Bacilli bacterium]